MKTTTTLFAFILFVSNSHAQNLEQRGGRGGNFITNQYNIDNVGNVAIFNNSPNQNKANTNEISIQQIQSNEDWNQVLDNVSRNVANDNVVQAIVVQQQEVIPSRGNRGNRREIMIENIAQARAGRSGNSAETNRGSRGAFAVSNPEQNQSEENSNTGKLASIELPTPKPLNLDLDLSLARDKNNIDIDISKTPKDKVDNKKTKQGGIYIERNYFKKRVWKPIKIWFKRTFKKQKKVKVKLDCFF